MLNLLLNKKRFKIYILLSIDLIILPLSVLIAFWTRIGELFWVPDQEFLFLFTFVYFSPIIIFIPFGYLFGLYKVIIRFLDFNFFYLLCKILFFYSVVWSIIIYVFHIPGFPRSLIVLQPLFLFIFILFSRIFIKIVSTRIYNKLNSERNNTNQIAIYGAGKVGRQLLSIFEQSQEYKVSIFVDDNKNKIGRKLSGVSIVSFNDFKKIRLEKNIREVHLALPNINRNDRNNILNKLTKLKVKIKTVPDLFRFVTEKKISSNYFDLSIEDILEKQPVVKDQTIYREFLRKKTILITGAGGSIGSEICREIIKNNPKKIILFDVSEYSIYKIFQELERFKEIRKIDNIEIKGVIGSIQDGNTVDSLVNQSNPDIIYHSAAYKHVPIVEENVVEGLKNNTFGTYNLARASIKYGIKQFVLISTDKAVRPKNIMGYSKRIAEMILQSLINEKEIVFNNSSNNIIKYSQKTNFTIVRFGNVLESSGSVIPLFRKQISEGGPVTITHPEVSRYFMTTQEAAQLVILAGTQNYSQNPQNVFLLDMGKPISIKHIAERMIEKNGLSIKDEKNPSGDIEIKYIGLRHGEKLNEELIISGKTEKTSLPMIYKCFEPYVPWEKLSLILINLKKIMYENPENIKNYLGEIVK